MGRGRYASGLWAGAAMMAGFDDHAQKSLSRPFHLIQQKKNLSPTDLPLDGPTEEPTYRRTHRRIQALSKQLKRAQSLDYWNCILITTGIKKNTLLFIDKTYM